MGINFSRVTEYWDSVLTKEFSKTKPLDKILKIISDILVPAVGRRKERYSTGFTVALTITVTQ